MKSVPHLRLALVTLALPMLGACATAADNQRAEPAATVASASQVCPEGLTPVLLNGSAYQVRCRDLSDEISTKRPSQRLRQPIDTEIRPGFKPSQISGLGPTKSQAVSAGG